MQQRTIKEVCAKFQNNTKALKSLLKKYHEKQELTKKADEIFECESEYTCFRLPSDFSGYALVSPRGFPTRRAIFFSKMTDLVLFRDEILNFQDHGVNVAIINHEFLKFEDDKLRTDEGLIFEFPNMVKPRLAAFWGVPQQYDYHEICPFGGEFLFFAKNDAGAFPVHSDLSEEFQQEIECLNYDFSDLTSKAFFDLLP